MQVADMLRPYAWGPSDESMYAYAARHSKTNSMFFVSARSLAMEPDLMSYEDHSLLLQMINDQEDYVSQRTGQEITWDPEKIEQTAFTFDQLCVMKRHGKSNRRVHSLSVLNCCPSNRYYLPCQLEDNNRWVVPEPNELPVYPQTFTMVGDALHQVFESYTGSTVRWMDLTTFATALKAGVSDVLHPDVPVCESVCANLHGTKVSFSQMRQACRWYFGKQRNAETKYREIISSCVSPNNKTRGSPEVHEFYEEYPMFMAGRCAFDFQRMTHVETGMYEMFTGQNYSMVPDDVRTMLMV